MFYFILYVIPGFVSGSTDSIPSFSGKSILFHIRGGGSIPIGKFSWLQQPTNTSHLENIYAAELGFNLQVGMDYFFSRNIGASFSCLHTSNLASTSDTSLRYSPNYWPGSGFEWQEYTSSFDVGRWISNGILAGFVMRSKDAPFRMSIRLQAGCIQMKYPEVNYRSSYHYYDFSQVDQYVQYSAYRQAIKNYFVAGSVGLDLQLKITKKICALISAEYITSKFSFEGTTHYATDRSALQQNSIFVQYHEETEADFSINKNVTLFYLNLGVSYSIR